MLSMKFAFGRKSGHQIHLVTVLALFALAAINISFDRRPAMADAGNVTLPVGIYPYATAVNLTTNRIYIANQGKGKGTVSVIDGSSNTVGDPIAVGGTPQGIGVNPTTNQVYVANADSTVIVLNGKTNAIVGKPVPVGKGPWGIAVNATTNRIYVADYLDGTVSVIDGSTNTMLGNPITVGKYPIGIGVNPTTNRIYAASQAEHTVYVIDGVTNTVLGKPIPVGKGPWGIGINPMTNTIYVSNATDSTVNVIDGSTNLVVGSPIVVGNGPHGIGVDPITNRIYVACDFSNAVSVIDGSANRVIGNPIPVGSAPEAVGVNTVDHTIYVTNALQNTVSVINLSTSGAGNPAVTPSPTALTGTKIVSTATAGVTSSTSVPSVTSASSTTAAPVTQAASTARTYNQWASKATATSQYGDTNWSASQATGVPNVSGCGDNGSAWASKISTGKDDLTVTFATPVVPVQVSVYESYNPGSITSIDLIPSDGSAAIPVSNSSDKGFNTCPGIFNVKVSGITAKVNAVVIHFDQANSPSWDEIDAVQLLGQPPSGLFNQYASAATATSQYGDSKWSAMQAAGAPNISVCGDNGNAWASKSASGIDTLTVTFAISVIPSQVNIYETFTPGSITSIDLIPADGSAPIPVSNSTDKGTPCPGLFSVKISAVIAPISGVLIHLDQTKSASWDEIDAVELIGKAA